MKRSIHTKPKEWLCPRSPQVPYVITPSPIFLTRKVPISSHYSAANQGTGTSHNMPYPSSLCQPSVHARVRCRQTRRVSSGEGEPSREWETGRLASAMGTMRVRVMLGQLEAVGRKLVVDLETTSLGGGCCVVRDACTSGEARGEDRRVCAGFGRVDSWI